MKKEINHSEFGKIVYNENIWTGKRSISINGKQLTKISKTSYKMNLENEAGYYVNIEGNMFKGTCLKIKGKTVLISPATKWYEYILGFMPLALVLIWGNSRALCEIIPIVGGAIGGAIGGVFTVLSIVFMKETKKAVLKLLIGIGCLAATFAICALIGSALVSLIA